ncbi:hypothetical protein QL285_025181 [Trifolium repens]|nr:hypothetical protein QL285_025181 [Trifolium repens]
MDSRRQAILQEDGKGTIRGLKRVRWSLYGCPKIPWTIGGKRFFERTELITPGVEEGVVKLVSYLKSDDSGEQAFLQGVTDLTSPESEEGGGESCGYQKILW